jgi:hypothetical protein
MEVSHPVFRADMSTQVAPAPTILPDSLGDRACRRMKKQKLSQLSFHIARRTKLRDFVFGDIGQRIRNWKAHGLPNHRKGGSDNQPQR